MKNEPSKSTEMVAVETAVANMDKVSVGLAELSKRFKGVIFEVTTPKGMTDAKSARREIAGPRIEVEKIRKAAKAPILELGRKLDAEAKRITEELAKIEAPIDAQIVAEENRIEAERFAKVEAEEKRVRDIQVRLTAMRDAITDGSLCKSAAQVSEIMVEIEDGYVIDDSYAEFRETAEVVKAEVLLTLDQMLKTHVEREKEDQRLREERAELSRQRAEQEARDKVERDKRDAEAKAESERLARERAAFEAEQAAAREVTRKENERIAAEQRAAQEIIDKANREIEARQQAERDAQAEREHQERVAAIAKANAEREAAEKVEREAEEQRSKNWRPTFAEIITVVAQHYDRDHDTVRTWIAEPKAARKAA